MKKTIIYCDRCGKEITSTVYQLAVFRSEPGKSIDFGDDVETDTGAELCEECFKIVDKATENAVKNVPDSKPQPRPRRKGPRLELDLGKMAALRNAGWSYDKIADELHVSQGTVINRMPEAIEFMNSQEADL